MRVLESFKATLQSALSPAANFGVTDLVVSDALCKKLEQSSNLNSGSENKNNKNGSTPLSPGAKAGLAFSIITLCVGIAILIMYVRLDIQYRRDRHFSHVPSRPESDRRGSALNPSKGTRVLGNKPRNSPESWGMLSFLQPNNDIARSSGDTDMDEESCGVLSVASTNHSSTGTRSSRSQHSYGIEDGRPIQFEFDPGFNPPLGRPDPIDDMFECDTSIADLTNIDEQILANDRRRRGRR